VKEFKTMIAKHKIDLPQGLSKDWTDEQITAMAKVSYALAHMWNHAIGSDWKEKVSVESIEGLFRRL
jgi:3-deoxy-alpha-D-manno-octulosonate 8-oxidase